MAKVNIKSEKITPFGEIYYASKAFYALSLDKIINGTLGVRSSTYNDYQWDEIMSAMSDVFLCGGSYSEDIIRTVDGNDRMKETVQANYRRIKEEVKQMVQEELERIKNDPVLCKLLPDNETV